MRFLLLLCLALLWCAPAAQAQDSTYVQDTTYNEDEEYVSEEADEPVIDTVVPVHEARSFDEGELTKFREDPALQYDRVPPPEEPGLWERFVDWFTRLLGRLFGKPVASAMRVLFEKYIIHALIIGGAAVLLFIAMRRAVFTRALRGKAVRASTVSDVHEELAAEDLGALAIEAERTGEWRRAVRLRYLLVLRHAIDQGWIQWRPEHTDRDYARQLTDPVKRAAFGRIAFTFQWVWYGDARLDVARYRELIAPFNSFIHAPA